MELSRPFAAITPTLDGDVLAVLALADTSFTPGQVHRVLAHYSEDGIRRVLRRLTSQGVVSSRRVGNAYSYTMNRQHLCAGPILEIARTRERLVAAVEERLRQWPQPPVYAAIFGSAQRGTMRLDSDIDLLLVRRDDCDREGWDDQVTAIEDAVTAWTGNDTRVLEFAESDVRSRGHAEPVLREVRSHGLFVAGTHAWLEGALSEGAG